MTYLFRLPTVREGPLFTNHRLGHFFALTRGVSVLKNHDGTYSQGRFYSQDEAAAAAFYYQGGHDYYVDDAEGAALIAAGFNPVHIGDSFVGYGEGGYGLYGYGGVL